MKLTRGRIAAFLLGVVLTAPAFAVPFDIALDGYPSLSDKGLYGLKSGTQNTKEAVEVTAGALNVNISSGSMTPPTGAAATQVQGNGADGAAAVGNAVRFAATDGSGNTQDVLSGTDGRLAENLSQVGGTTILTGSGATAAGSQRVTVAVDSATVAGSASLPTGANTIGAVTQSGTWTGTSDGTTTGSVVAGDTGQNAQVVTGSRKETTFSVAATTTVCSTDVSNYRYVSVHVTTATLNGTPTSQISNDNSNWVTLPMYLLPGGNQTNNPNVSGTVYGAPLVARYFRINDATHTTGTYAGNCEFFSVPPASTVAVFTTASSAQADGVNNTISQAVDGSNGPGLLRITVRPEVYAGTGANNWERPRSATAGNSIAATGITAAAPYGEYLTLANQPAPTTGQYGVAQTDSVFNLKVTPGAPAIGNILTGRQTFTSTTGATTLVTITAGKSVASLKLVSSVSCAEAAAATVSCQANATFTTTGAGMTPAAGTIFACDAKSGANAATGTVGSEGNNFCAFELPVSCASGTCTIAVASTNAGTSSLVEASASGIQQ